MLGNPLRTRNRAVTEERNNAAKYRDKPKTKYGNAQKWVKHLVPDLLVGRPLVGEEGKKGRHEQRPQPQEPGVSSQYRCLLIATHNLLQNLRAIPIYWKITK